MKRHPLDPLSFVLGVLVIAAAIAALAGSLGELFNEPAAAVPIAAGLAGLALIASVVHRPGSRAPRVEPEPEPIVWRDPGAR